MYTNPVLARCAALTAIAVLATTTATLAVPEPPATRAVVAPSPTPSPAASAASRAATPVQALQTVDVRGLRAARMATLARSEPRIFSRAQSASTLPPRPSTVQVAAHADVALAARAAADYCAKHPMDVDRVSGSITPGGRLSVTGACFGSAGRLRMAGSYYTGIPMAPNAFPDGIDLEVASWSDASVTARVPDVWGIPDQPVEIRMLTRRTASAAQLSGAYASSAPIRVNFVAARDTISVATLVDALSCTAGTASDALAPDSCATPWANNCPPHTCMFGGHVRRAPGSGSDTYALRLRPGFVLDGVQMYGANADVVFEPSIDPTHVTWTVRWHTVPAADPAAATHGHPELASYHDGSYMFGVTVRGPKGVQPR